PKIDCVPVAGNLRHESRKQAAQFRMKFHVVFEDQQGLVSSCNSFAHRVHVAEGAAVCSGQVAPVRRDLNRSSVHGIPTCDFEMMLLELCPGLGPAVWTSRKIDADPVWKASRQVELSAFNGSHDVRISQYDFPLRPNNAISAARISNLDRRSHLWNSCRAS